MAEPLITIGICAYDSRDTVARSIASALAQDWPNKEILIVDDGSPDSTADIIEQAIRGHETVARLIRHEKNKGFAGALNTVIAEAKGEFLAIFDDDDESVPERIRAQYNRITSYEKKSGAARVLCHGARMQVFPNGYERYEGTMGTEMVPSGFDVADRILMGRVSPGVVGSCANCSRMGRIGIFRELGGYDSAMRRAEDTDFNARFAQSGGHFAGIAAPLVRQTMTTGSEKTLSAERAAERLVLEKHKNYLVSRGWYDVCREWLEARYEYLGGEYTAVFRRLLKLAVRYPVKCTLKFFWALPARRTRGDFKKWHAQKFMGGKE